MFQTIVMATDLSPAWDDIIACGEEFRDLGCSRIILTHVIMARFFSGTEAILREDAREKIDFQSKLLESMGYEVHVEMPVGAPAFALNDVAQGYGASLVVVGSHGRSLWRQALLGSVSNAVLHHSRVPVLVLNVELLAEEGTPTCKLKIADILRHVLFPTDFPSAANRASDCLVELAGKGIEKVTILHALEAAEHLPVSFVKGEEATATACFEALEKRLRVAGVTEVSTYMSRGNPISVILGFLEKQDVSMILLGSHGKGYTAEVLLGSVAYNVARMADRTVLLIPGAGS